MKSLIIFFCLIFYSFYVYSDPIEVIELHDNIINQNIEDNADNNVTKSDKENLLKQALQTNITEEDSIEVLNKLKNDTLTNEDKIIISNLWIDTNKKDINFLFENLEINESNILTNLLINTLTKNTEFPSFYTQSDFDNLKIKTLIKLGKRKEAINFLQNINSQDIYKDYYDLLRLNYLFVSNNLSEACDYKETFKDNLDVKSNYILKINIFCAFLQNKIEESDFLNSLLNDSNEDDNFFQKIYFNLKNDINEEIDFDLTTYDLNSFSLYSAMLRIGNMPLNEKFLDYDPTNLSLPIILSSSTDILLRLKSAHRSYELELLNSESVSALYQSVDFNLSEIEDSQLSLENFVETPELGMALLYQKANIQLLPITRLESLKEFWKYSKEHNLEFLAYDISRSLLTSIEPSSELLEYALLIAKAHINNSNFDLAKKWILFAEQYTSDNENEFINETKSIKLLFNLKTSENDEVFIENILNNEIYIFNDENFIFNEVFNTILSPIINEKNLDIRLAENQKLIDQRIMPSRYIIEKMINSSNKNSIGELILSINVSINNKSWIDIHPHHLKIIIECIRRTELKDFYKELVIEILEDIRII